MRPFHHSHRRPQPTYLGKFQQYSSAALLGGGIPPSIPWVWGYSPTRLEILPLIPFNGQINLT